MDTVYDLESFRVKLAINEPPGQTISDSERAAAILRALYAELDADKEHFSVLFLDNKNQIRGFKVISTGSATASIVNPAVVLRAALLFGATALILGHNHPSGVPDPGGEDIDITNRLRHCAELFSIRLLDHIILGADRYVSFKDRSMMDEPCVAQEIFAKPSRRRRRKKRCPRSPVPKPAETSAAD